MAQERVSALGGTRVGVRMKRAHRATRRVVGMNKAPRRDSGGGRLGLLAALRVRIGGGGRWYPGRDHGGYEKTPNQLVGGFVLIIGIAFKIMGFHFIGPASVTASRTNTLVRVGGFPNILTTHRAAKIYFIKVCHF